MFQRYGRVIPILALAAAGSFGEQVSSFGKIALSEMPVATMVLFRFAFARAGLPPFINKYGRLAECGKFFPMPSREVVMPPGPMTSNERETRLGCLPFCLHGKSGVLPCLETALKSPRVLVALLLKFAHQTGARPFAWSCAIRHYRSGLGDSGEVFVDLVERHPDRFWYRGIRFRPSRGIAHVDHREIFS